MSKMQDARVLKQQYQTSQNLKTRVSLHTKYSTNKQGFGNWFFEKYKFFNGCRILELGCGTGGMWRDRITTIGNDSSLVLSDFSVGMIEEAKRNVGEHANVIYQCIDIINIPYNQNTFDFVIANMMLYHLTDLSAALKEVRRVLHPEGIFYCATFGENGINNYFNESLAKQGIQISINGTFTLQNGGQILKKEFDSVQRVDYIDGFEITDTNDLLDYLFSLSSVSDVNNLDRDDLFLYFEKQKDENGIIHIPKEYGMFIADGLSNKIDGNTGLL